MPNRRAFQSHWKFQNSRKQKAARRDRRKSRRSLLEQLEQRQLLAIGPQLAGIQPDAGALLRNGDVLDTSPRELKFQFNDGAMIDASTLSGILLSRSDTEDFATATATSDFNTNGQVVIDFRARSAGTSGNGIRIEVIKNATPTGPLVSVVGGVIKVELNTTTGTTASALVASINSHPQAGQLVSASIRRGPGTTNLSQAAITYSPIVTSGANAASTTTDLGVGASLQMKLTATQAGPAGSDISVLISRRDFGGVSPPRVTVSGRVVTVEVNSNIASPTTAGELVSAINGNIAARALVTASLPIGNPNTLIGNRTPSLRLQLIGVADIPVVPGFIGLGDSPREVVMRFSEPLPDAFYHVEIVGFGSNALRDENGAAFGDLTDDAVDDGTNFGLSFRLDLGAQVLAIVPQPLTRNPVTNILTQARSQIYVYFNDDDLFPTRVITNTASTTNPSVVDPAFYQLISTNETVQNTDDEVFLPQRIDYDPLSDLAVLIFDEDIEDLGASGGGSFRLRIGTDESLPVPPLRTVSQADEGSSFDTAQVIGQLDSLVISSQIEAKPYDLTYPGGLDEPGHREIPEESHLNPFFSADEIAGITTLAYNFRPDIGNDPAGRPLFNVITEEQKERAREVFHIYGEKIGVQFIETDIDGMMVATGDLRAIIPNIPTGPRDGVLFASETSQNPITGSVTGRLILDNAENWDDSFGATDSLVRISWFETALQGIGGLLGLGATTDLPPAVSVAGGIPTPTLQFDNPPDRVYPSPADIVHGQYLYRPEGQDIDMFRIDVPETGLFSAEIIAERQLNSSLLDSVMMLFRDVPGSTPELIARNDDYYSKDSYFELELAAGTYWVGVSASGNDQYNPVIEDSGFGGLTEGAYDLRLNFRPDADRELKDATGVALDGDGNGTPGGAYNFWFEAQDETRTIFVDKAAPAFPTGPLGSIRNPHTLISTALLDVVGRGTSSEDFIIRIVGNGGDDQNIATLGDNIPYEIGFMQLGGALADGASLEVPKGVTVMIDSGAVIKSRRGYIAAGSSSPTVDHSEAALQVLGTPVILDSSGFVVLDLEGKVVPGSVYFTSLHDDTIGAPRGLNGHLPAAAGDWGGLVFQADVDRSDANRVDVEDRGIFMNYVNNADMRYGGGIVVVDGIPQVVNPIHMTDARVTATFNTISFSSDAAISASPDSFEETNFHAAEYQFSPFTSEYQRVGPDLYGNRLIDNSINGLFVRVLTPAGGALRPLTVPGRFDDRDITHVLAENLVIQGTPGGPIQEGDRPVSQFVTLSPVIDPGPGLDPGTYNYKIVFVDADGNEGLSSPATLDITIASPQNSIRLLNLPLPTAGFVSRRIYRSDETGDRSGAYTLVTEINGADTFFTDDGREFAGTLRSDTTLGGERPVVDFVAPLAVTATDLQVTGDGSTVVDGATFTITPIASLPIIFEFLDSTSMRTTTGTRAVRFDSTSDQATLAGVIADAIAAAGIQSVLNGTAISMANIQSVGIGFGASATIAQTGFGSLFSGVYNYKIAFVDAAGNEGLASVETRNVTVSGTQDSVLLQNLPTPTDGFVSTRIYRSNSVADPLGPYTRVGEISGSESFFFDTGNTIGLTLQTNISNLRARLDGRLAIDPGIVVKLNGATIETRFGSQLIAEGLDGQEVIFTSINDDTYGSGGTFDTGNNEFQEATPGDWGGLYLGHMSRGSLDHAQVSFGGGVTRIEGNFTGFNAVEIQQAEVRIANSAFRDNADGAGSQFAPNRAGRGENGSSLIFVRGAQPVIVDNMMLNNAGSVISIDANSLDASAQTDIGRSTYNRGEDNNSTIDLLPGYIGNSGPLVRLNALDGNDINGLQVRGATLTTQSVWDDTDMVHVLLDQTVYVPDFHTFGGLRLESSASQSLVVKLQGDNAGFTATGRPLDIEDRIGGSLQVIGQPTHPVVLTSLDDCTVGAGFDPNGQHQVATLESSCIGNENDFDIFLLFDDTGSFASVAPALVSVFDQVVTDLTSAFPNASFTFGVGRFEEYADTVSVDERPFILNQPLVESTDPQFDVALQSALVRTAPGFGIDFPETDIEGLFQVATGLGFDGNGDGDTIDSGAAGLVTTQVAPGASGDVPTFASFTADPTGPVLPPAGTLGGVGFRPGANHIVLLATDASFVFEADAVDPYVGINGVTVPATTFTAFGRGTTPGGRGAGIQETIDALLALGVKVVGLGTGIDPAFPPRLELEAISRLTGAIDSAGNPLYFPIDPLNSAGIAQSLIDAVVGTLGAAQPGDWRSIEIEEFSNDRNVDMVAEREPAELAAPGNNFNPSKAQFLGALAPHEKAGDESLRLGFEIHGVVAEPGDYDVYSFDAQAGTEVWFDIDRTSYALDTVIELIDASGAVHQGVVLANPTQSVFARSDDSVAESSNPAVAASLTVRPLQKSASNEPDRYSTNPKDAGMRVVLPGALNTTNTFYLRVRSSSGDPTVHTPGSGLTKGVYQLQIRLREQDEVAGTTVKYSDIRFAQNGIFISGQPTHSPLLGEATETLDAAGVDTNDNFNAPEVLGNVLNTDRAALGVAGELDLPDDVDWFEFNVEYDSIQGQTAITPRHASLAFDLDYADGFARPNTNIWVFDDAGLLVAVGRDSNIADDRSAPLRGADVTDLTKGSVGALDPFIGPIELPARGTESGRYFVAIASNAIIPVGMEQFLTELPSDPLVRLEPVNSVPRIAEDHVNGTNLSNIAQPPQVPVLFDNASADPFNLGDVGLFALDNVFGVSRVRMVDPFTGALENTVGIMQANVDDLALNPAQGLLYGFSVPLGVNPNDANTGNYHQIDPRLTTTQNLSTNLGDDGIETYNQDPMNAAPTALRSNNTAGVGVRFDAIAIGDDGTNPLSGYAVGSRFAGLDVDDTRNLLYEFDPLTGTAFSAPRNNRTGNTGVDTLTQGAWTNIVEHAALETSFDPSVPPGAPTTAIRAVDATTIDPLGATVSNIQDGESSFVFGPTTLTVTGGGVSRTFEFNTGPEVQIRQSPQLGITVRDGDNFSLDGVVYEFDTGTVLNMAGVSQATVRDNDTLTITPTVGSRTPVTIEFDTDGDGDRSVGGSILINSQTLTNQAQIIGAIVTTINNLELADQVNVPNARQFNVTVAVVGGTRLSFTFQNLNFASPLPVDFEVTPVTASIGGVVPAQVTIQGTAQNTRPGTFIAGAVRVLVEETMTADELGVAIAAAIPDPTNPLSAGHDGSAVGDRLNFSGAIDGDFSGVTPGVFFNLGSTGLVTAGSIPIDFLAEDDATAIANRIVTAINNAFGAGTATVNSSGDVIQLATGFSVTASLPSPFLVGGVAPGDDITGLAWIGFQLFAVGDRGGLYQINFPQTFFAEADYVESSTELSGITFSALTAGPANLGYGNLLFGIDTFGVLHAFDTNGVLQPIFVDGQTSVATGLFGVDGLAFSNLDYNLWHVTDARRGDAGHGVEEVVDGSRATENNADNLSWYFGYESPQANNIIDQRLTDAGNTFDYDFIGGAHGSLISNPFDLDGFSAADLPTLYYNYYLDTDNGSATLRPDQFMTDSFRVYVSGDDGVWHLVSTNNAATGPDDDDDEYDDPTTIDNTLNLNLPSNVDAEVQQNFDDVNNADAIEWRQARIPLGAFAGQSNLRLRFDFDTAGGRGPQIDGVPLTVADDLLRQNTVGFEIRAVDAALLRDGQKFTLQTIDSFGVASLREFELDLGYTLVAPRGDVLTEGSSFTANGRSYIFDDTATPLDPTVNMGTAVAVPYTTSDTSQMVANSIYQAILNNLPAPIVTQGDLTDPNGPTDNDVLSVAVDTTLRGISASFQAVGAIGDNLNQTNAALDVDMLRLEMQAGDIVNIDLDSNANALLFNGYLRVFDSSGTEQAANSVGTAPGEVGNGRDPYLSFTATTRGTYYIGVSDATNTSYDAITRTAPGTATPAVDRRYSLDVSLDVAADRQVFQQGNRVNLPYVTTVTASGTPTGFVEGSAGVGANAFPINLNITMSASDDPTTPFIVEMNVADEIALALSNAYATDAPGVVPVQGEVVKVIGHTFASQSRGLLLGQPLGVSEPLYGDLFGAFQASTYFDGSTDAFLPGALRLQDNNHEGLYLDDFIIGLAERGEMVTGSSNQGGTIVPTSFVANAAQPDNEIDLGPYQLEIRRSQDFGVSVPLPVPTLVLTNGFNSNARLGQQATISATSGGMLADGEEIQISDGLGVLIFEFEDDALDGVVNNGRGNGVTAGHIAVPFLASHTANEIAERIRDTVNSAAVQTRLKITAALADGAVSGPLGTSSTVNLFGNAIVTLLDPSTTFATTQSNGVGDSNRVRGQGQLVIESNTIRDSAGFGIIAGPGDRDISTLAPLAGNLPHAGPVRVTREVNTARLAPGVVIANNLVINNRTGGIQFSGDANVAGDQLASMAFGRIVNNTVVGQGSGTGIEVGPNASPTLLNNIVADFTTGISVTATSNSTVIGGTLYRGNTTNTAGIGVGSFPVFLTTAAAPLFVDEANGNYYLATGSRAIDSSVDSLPDRPALVSIRSPLGINPSPILVPKQDALGQTRVDDPTVQSPPGQGANVFKDRGALDRADFAGPTPVLITPQDNDSLRQDSDTRITFINLTNRALQNFAIQLLDGVEPNNPQNGTGASDASVRSDRLTLLRDDVPLVEGIDYKFTYDATNKIIRLTPLAGIWEADHRYDIVLSNSRGFLITAPDGSQVVDGDSFNVADTFGNSVNFEFDSGYVLQVPQTLALQIPDNAAALLTDRSTITVTDSTTATTVIFEFDLDGFVTLGNQSIPFTRTDSSNEIAQAIVTAMEAAAVGLSPVNHVNFGGRAVHLGTRSTHTVNLSNSQLTATGQLAGIDDGQTFIVDDGVQRIIFEFTSTGSLTTGDRAIQFSFAETNEQIAESVAAAIGGAGLGLSPRYVALSDGLINVGGEVRHFLDASNSTLIQTGTPGATSEFGIRIPTVAGQLDFTQIMDGEQFTITNGTDSVTFELDDDGIIGTSTNPLVVVSFTNSTTIDRLANDVAIAIRDPNLNLGLSPANVGRGIINLLNATQQTIDLTNSSFTQRGTAGVAASVAIPFDAGTSFVSGTSTRVPIDSAESIATAITAAINSARATGQLQGVFATQEGREVNLEGVPANGVTGLGTLATSEIVDVAGNALLANRPDGTSRFTITIASGLDYGDAPATYPTKLADNGARHQASVDFTLGLSVDVDSDGQPHLGALGDDLASADDEDGVSFPNLLVGGSTVNIAMTASRNGFVDAWIDFNQDEDWNDAGEQVLTARAVVGNQQINSVPIIIPGTALPGNTFARFRLSSTGGLPPTGEAADGEVEDHLVNISGNPWHNSANPLDVDGNGFVVPLDALIVINYINANGAGPLPSVPPAGNQQVDTSGDGSATPIDVLLIVNELNDAGVVPEGESSVGVASSALQEAGGDPLTLLTSNIVVDQRIDVYEQRETHAEVQWATREAIRRSANDDVFGSVDAFAGTSDDRADAGSSRDENADELDDLTPDQPWASGVDDLFSDWV